MAVALVTFVVASQFSKVFSDDLVVQLHVVDNLRISVVVRCDLTGPDITGYKSYMIQFKYRQII